MCLLRKVRHEDTRKTYGLEVTDITHFLHRCAVTFQWNLELIPLHGSHLIVAQFDGSLHNAGYVLLPYALHILRAQRYMVTIEALAIVERIVVVNILYIRVQGRSTTISLILHGLRRVTLRTVVTFVAKQDRCLCRIIVIAAIVVVVITCGVTSWRELILRPHFPNGTIHLVLQSFQILRIWVCTIIVEVHRIALLLGGQSIESHVLFRACTCLIGESDYSAGSTWNQSPYGAFYLAGLRLIQWQSVLKTLLTIAQNILTHITQVNIQVTTCVSCIGVRQEWIHQPELYVFYIGFLKVRIIQLTHDTTPAVLWIGQFTIRAYHISRDIIRTALIGIITQVQHRQTSIGIGHHLFVWIHLLFIYGTCAVVAHKFYVILNMFRCIATWFTKDWVHRVPRQQRTVSVVVYLSAQRMLWEVV